MFVIATRGHVFGTISSILETIVIVSGCSPGSNSQQEVEVLPHMTHLWDNPVPHLRWG
ncbi:hypothetical protein SCLCIDRAFT_1216912 [Scleroderma citrinum Foug A]|uniref:Uncharacterized protein n=1 Tax=Scleroderma citrinum Foug A TaxID=1036808 RepID=A0A0C3DWM1_9AGAM|nr:hypothetical protein SCLCIDRAFT_1216912 [Scleroderma citrinum Foug A]